MNKKDDTEVKPFLGKDPKKIVSYGSTPGSIQQPTIDNEPLSRRKFFMLGLSYASYTVPLFYAIFLFYQVSKYLIAEDESSEHENESWDTLLSLLVYSTIGFSALSDFYTNIIATKGVPELVYDFSNSNNEKSFYEDNIYVELGLKKQKIVRTSMYLSKFLSFGSFTLVGLACVDALVPYVKNPYYLIGPSILLIPLGALYARLLLYDKTKIHHVFIMSRLLGTKIDAWTYLKEKPFETIELSLEILSNLFYKALTFGYLASIGLNYVGVSNKKLNLVVVAISAFLGAFQSLFTRYIPSKTFVLDAPVYKSITDEEYRVFTANRIANLVFTLVRTGGISYLIYRFVGNTEKTKIIVTATTTLPLLLQGLIYIGRLSNSRTDFKNTGHIDRLNMVSNFMARVLRVGAIMAFSKNLSIFLDNNDVSLNLSNLDALMLSMASVGVESINYHFYRDALRSGITYWKDKHRQEKRYSESKNMKFSGFRFLSRSKQEYPQLENTAGLEHN